MKIWEWNCMTKMLITSIISYWVLWHLHAAKLGEVFVEMRAMRFENAHWHRLRLNTNISCFCEHCEVRGDRETTLRWGRMQLRRTVRDSTVWFDSTRKVDGCADIGSGTEGGAECEKRDASFSSGIAARGTWNHCFLGWDFGRHPEDIVSPDVVTSYWQRFSGLTSEVCWSLTFVEY